MFGDLRGCSSCDIARVLLRKGGGVSIFSKMALPGIESSVDFRLV